MDLLDIHPSQLPHFWYRMLRWGAGTKSRHARCRCLGVSYPIRRGICSLFGTDNSAVKRSLLCYWFNSYSRTNEVDISSWESVTGGGDGLNVPLMQGLPTEVASRVLYTMLLIAIIVFLVSVLVDKARLGVWSSMH